MKSAGASIRDWAATKSPLETVFRGVVIGNVLLVALSWWPWFEGTVATVGEVDRLLGPFRLGGFRPDVLWLTLSTFLIGLLFFAFLFNVRTSRSARINMCLCVVELFA